MKILGYEFREFTDNDWSAFSGAEKGSLIHYGDEFVLIYDPAKKDIFYQDLDHIGQHGGSDWFQVWTLTHEEES